MERIIDFCKKNFLVIYGSLIFVICFLVYLNNNYTFFWFDEGFSLNLIKHSYSDIWFFTGEDVHPPFYYFLLKAHTSVFGDSVLSARFFSAIPVLLTIVAACTLVRKEWGNKAAIYLLLLLILTPMTKYMTSEIRMYSWAMFLVLMSFIYAYLSFTKDRKYYYLLFLLFSVMAAYTHYYALISIFFIYVVFFILSLLYKRNKVLPSILISIAFVLGYAPWLMTLLSQVKTVSEDYWIDIDMWKHGLTENIYPVNKIGVLGLNDDMSFYLKLFILAAFFAYAFYIAYKSVKDKNVFRTAVITFLLFILPLFAGIIYTVTLKPVFISRYMCCFAGLYYLGAALLFSAMDLSKKASRITLFIFFFLSLYLNVSLFKYKFRDNRADSLSLSEMVDFINKDIDEKTAFLYTDSVYAQIAIYPLLFPDNIHISKKDPGSEKHKAVLSVFNKIQVLSFENIDTTYTQLYIADHYPEGGMGLMQIKQDSIQIAEQFDIVDKIEIARYEFSAPSRVYRLKRRTVD